MYAQMHSSGHDLHAGELELVHALLQHERTTEAAASLGVDQSTISRRLAQLERRLGIELFVRAPRGVIATPLAERLREPANAVVSSLRAASQLVQDGSTQPSGRLRIACPEAMAQHVLAPRLAKFLGANPNLSLTLLDGPELVDLAAAEVHLAVRMVRPISGDVVSKIFMTDLLAPFGSKRYVGGRPASALRWLGWDDSFARLGEAQALKALLGRDPEVRFSRLTTMISAAKEGVGVMLLGRRFGRMLGLKEAPFPGLPVMKSSVWLAAPRVLRQSPAVAAAWDWLLREADQFVES